MARLNVDRSSRIEPPRLPYQKHPIFRLRKLLIVFAIIGITLSFLAMIPYGGAPFAIGVFLLAVSGFFAMADLTQYAMKKVQNPDDDPEWPKLAYIIVDVLLAIILQFFFWVCVAEVESRYYYAPAVLPSYAALCYFLCSVTHVYSFWRQLMARYKQKWIKTLPPVPCSRCGYLEPTSDAEAPCNHPPNTVPYAGPSASFAHSAAAVSRAPSEAAMEEGLLIGSEFESTMTSYGAIDTPELTIDRDEQIVVSKAKKKKKGKEPAVGRA